MVEKFGNRIEMYTKKGLTTVFTCTFILICCCEGEITGSCSHKAKPEFSYLFITQTGGEVRNSENYKNAMDFTGKVTDIIDGEYMIQNQDDGSEYLLREFHKSRDIIPLQIGCTYHFVNEQYPGWPSTYGLKVFDTYPCPTFLYGPDQGEVLLFMGVSDWDHATRIFVEDGFEGFKIIKGKETNCIVKYHDDCVSIRNVPTSFSYGGESVKLFQSEEKILQVNGNNYLINLLISEIHHYTPNCDDAGQNQISYFMARKK